MVMKRNSDPHRSLDAARDAILDAALIHAIQDGLPLVERPYAALAAGIGVDETALLERLGQLLAQGAIKRLGVVVRHQELGYRANAMVVWDLPDDQVDALGERMGGLPFVTLCYRRPRRLPDWPYNLFSMIHGRSRESVLAQVEAIREALGLGTVCCAVLFSGRRFKQRGARYRSAHPSLGKPPRTRSEIGPRPAGAAAAGSRTDGVPEEARPATLFRPAPASAAVLTLERRPAP